MQIPGGVRTPQTPPLDPRMTLKNSVLCSSITTEGERMRGGVIMTEEEMSLPLR